MPFFIAEISSNHNNSMDRIKKKLSSLRKKNLVSMQLNFKFLKSKNYFIRNLKKNQNFFEIEKNGSLI